jgi:hypothetical protein
MAIGTILFSHNNWYLYFSECPKGINIQDTSPITAYGLGTWTGGRAAPKGEAATGVPA